MRIRKKLLILLVLVSIIPLGIIGLIVMEDSRDTLYEQIGLSSLEYARLTAERINEYLYFEYKNNKAWASNGVMMDVLTDDVEGNISILLKNIQNNHGDYYYIACLNRNGTIIASGDSNIIGENLSKQPGFRKALNGETYVEDVKHDDIVKNYVLTFWIPIKKLSNPHEIIGVLCSTLKWGVVNEMVYLLRIQNNKQDISNHIMLTDNNGLVIFCVDPHEIFTTNLIKFGMKSAKHAQQSKEGYLIETSEHGLKSFIAYTYVKKYKDLPNPGWLLVILQDPQVIFGSVEKLENMILYTMIIIGFILLASSFIIAHRITRPILMIESTAQAIIKGDWERKIDISSKDEIGVLANTFKKMVEYLKKYSEHLKSSREYTENIISNMIDSIIVVSPDNKIGTINQATLDLLGFKEEELIGKDLHILFPGEGKEAPFLGNHEYPFNCQIKNYEVCFKTKEDNKIPVLLNSSVIKEENGAISNIIYVARDISDRKRAEEILAAEKERLAVTLRSIVDGVITTDTEEKINFINEIGEELTGWAQDEVIGKPLGEIFFVVHEKTRERCENPIEKSIKTGEMVELEKDSLLIAKGGTERNIAGSCALIRGKNREILGVVFAFRDITEKLKMEEELIKTQKLDSVGILAGGIAHDFNNIVTGVMGNLSYAKILSNPESEIFEILTEAEKASRQAKDLTLQLLTFSQGGSPIKKTISMKEILKDMTSFALRGSNIRCDFSIADDLWPVDADEGQISQVINNLVINGAQAMPDGGTITVHADNLVMDSEHFHLSEHERYIKISIKDTGIGIPKEHFQKIFDPYFTTKQRGSGLGLATSYSILKKHDGYIDVESEIGAGSTFHVYIPASQNDIRVCKSVVKENIIDKKQVLFMDDNDITRDLINRALKRLGYKVELAKDGSEVIELFIKSKGSGETFDVLILDLTVPGGLGGKETIRQLLEIDPMVRAIVSSGYSNDPIMADYKKYGFCGVIAKPYSIDELESVLSEVICKEIGKVGSSQENPCKEML